MDRVRSGEFGWRNLDALHRASLDELLDRFGLGDANEDERAIVTRAWHALPLLSLKSSQVMLVAAHPRDLAAAQSFGLQTAYIDWPLEHGAPVPADEAAVAGFDYRADSLAALAA